MADKQKPHEVSVFHWSPKQQGSNAVNHLFVWIFHKFSGEWRDVMFLKFSKTFIMMTSPNGKFSALLAICAWHSPFTGEFPAQRPVTRSFDVFFDLLLNKRLSKQWWSWWFEKPSRPLGLPCNDHNNHACNNRGARGGFVVFYSNPDNLFNIRRRIKVLVCV